jgi:hypothetical protein
MVRGGREKERKTREMTRTGYVLQESIVSGRDLEPVGFLHTDRDYLSGSRNDIRGKFEKIHDMQNLMFSLEGWKLLLEHGIHL